MQENRIFDECQTIKFFLAHDAIAMIYPFFLAKCGRKNFLSIKDHVASNQILILTGRQNYNLLSLLHDRAMTKNNTIWFLIRVISLTITNDTNNLSEKHYCIYKRNFRQPTNVFREKKTNGKSYFIQTCWSWAIWKEKLRNTKWGPFDADRWNRTVYNRILASCKSYSG